MVRQIRGILTRLLSDDWRMPIALTTGVALLLGYSLQVLVGRGVDEAYWGRSAGFFHGLGHALVWVSLFLGAIHGVKAAARSVRRLEPNIDVLMVVGAFLAAGINHPGEGALLLFMFTLAGALEHRALARAKDAVARLSRLMPDEAMKRAPDGTWSHVKPDTLVRGDVVMVRPGETIPADGKVVEGRSTVDQSTLTGESLPRAVDAGDEVYAGTMNQNGVIEAQVTRPVGESSLRRILDLVIEAQAQRQPLQRVIDRFSTPYTVAVFAFAIGVFVFSLLLAPNGDGTRGWPLDRAAYRAITLLIVCSPCALVIATPTATLCGLNRAARGGLLVKGGDALERLSLVRVMAFDKTGTLTTGRLEVVGVEAPGGGEIGSMLPIVLAIEERSTHPIAAAITRWAVGRGVKPAPMEGFEMIAGKGIEARAGGEAAWIGTVEYVAGRLEGPLRGRGEEATKRVREEGRLTAVFAQRGRALVFALADTARPGAERLVPALRAVGVKRVVMLTGDYSVIAQRVAREVGVDEFHAELLPEEKVDHLRALRETNDNGRGGRGRLAGVGDGVNDAPALAIADVGLAMGGVGADAALETADVVILNDDLMVVPWAIALARRVRVVMFLNLAFAVGVIALLAAGALLGWVPMGMGVIGHEGSTLIVVGNSLQILAFRGAR